MIFRRVESLFESRFRDEIRGKKAHRFENRLFSQLKREI